MNTFYIAFRDPLFGIILFFLLLFLISFLSYWGGRYKASRAHRSLESFLGKFDESSDPTPIASQIHNNTLNNESWLLLAQSFELQGNYEKSVEIYLAILSKYSDPLFQKEVLLLLGKTYFKAGFLERSRVSFVQVLENHPRTPVALHYLILLYEQLQQFDKALEVSESLLELQPQSHSIQTYLQCRFILVNPKLSIDERCEQLAAVYRETLSLGYLIFDYLFTHRSALAWEIFDHGLAHRLSDVLWRLGEEKLDLAIISRNVYLCELFTARGAVELAQNSSVFELDTLIALRKCGSSKATLQFEYACSECKQISFIPFHRCPHCHTIDTVSPILILSKEHFEENNSFQ
ncbi:MAG: tetratricopeptide repeat protein [Sulfuricurvum sp.]|nr:tetratricopeptide repeat protein [Sulfuricurvum sp.]